MRQAEAQWRCQRTICSNIGLAHSFVHMCNSIYSSILAIKFWLQKGFICCSDKNYSHIKAECIVSYSDSWIAPAGQTFN